MNQKYLKNVVTLKLNADKCKGCGKCMEVCPHAIFEMKDKKSHIVDRDRCMECGACAKNCPFNAISVKIGVVCAHAFITGKLPGTEPTCGCSGESGNRGCC